MITRFAPSPTGYLHLGNIRTALFNYLLAKKHGGVMQLRLEDTDRARNRPQYEQAIADDLAWLGLDFAGDEQGRPWRQSQRLAIYQDVLARLGDAGYPCFCSAEELAAQRRKQLAAGKPPRYNGKCARLAGGEAARRLDAGEAAVWRFRVPSGQTLQVSDWVRGSTTYDTDDLGDFVLRRANGDFSFLFVNAVDDALLGVTDVLRGEDHVTNTPRQLLLLQALQLPAPRYGHVPLITGADGKPLSKRHGLTSVRDWRQRGYLPEALLNYLARVGHTYRHADADAFMTRAELGQHFDGDMLGRAPAQYDATQLERRQKENVLRLSPREYRQWLGALRDDALYHSESFYRLTRENVILPSDADSWHEILIEEDLPTGVIASQVLGPFKADRDFYLQALAAARLDSWQEFCAAIGEQSGKKGKALFLPLRAALTGRTDGPAMPLLYEHLSVSQRQRRLNAAADEAD